MRFFRHRGEGGAVAAALLGDRLVPITRFAPALAPREPESLDEIVQAGRLPAVARAAQAASGRPSGPRLDEVELLAPLVRPPKIWCVGLNYRAHAADLDAALPSAPVGFMRPAASIIGPGAPIRLPRASSRVTGEGELVCVLGRAARDLDLAAAAGAVAAFTLAVDSTAEDILRQNPRFLTRAKSFDTFLSLGPCLATPDELGGALPDVRITTLHGGRPARSAPVRDMSRSPASLIAFFSEDMTWRAGDILLTGTPGAVPIRPGDTVGAEARGIGRLENPVHGNPVADDRKA